MTKDRLRRTHKQQLSKVINKLGLSCAICTNTGIFDRYFLFHLNQDTLETADSACAMQVDCELFHDKSELKIVLPFRYFQVYGGSM